MAARKPAKSVPKKAAPKKVAAKATPAKTAAKAAPVPPAADVVRDAIYPIVDRTPWGIVALVLGIVGLGGIGTILTGVINGRHVARDITFGILQFIPFLGNLWGLVWGILIFAKGNK